MSSQGEHAGAGPGDQRHGFDEAALADWLAANVDGFEGAVTVSRFAGGQSNPTYRLDTPSRSYVLRRKPSGILLPSAHAVDREFRVITALHKAGFPVARPYALCRDDAVIGSMFYVMEMVEGRVFWDGALPGCTPQERRAIYESKITALAQLHQLSPEAVGLGDFGKPGNYFARQVERWSRQYRASETDPIPAMDRLIEWLPRTVPVQERTSVVHGDYRLDNMIFAADRPDVLAVLDWELSTLGDPLADFSYLLMSWVLPANGRSGLSGLDLPALGIPTQDEAVALYCGLTGRDGVPDLNWYFAYSLFRASAISQGIAGRVRDGTAASAEAVQAGAAARPYAERDLAFAERAGA